MRPPVILCAFANSHKDHLTELEKEKENIASVLVDKQVLGHVLFDNDIKTIKKLRDLLFIYRPQVMVLHYAGHANDQQIFMEDGAAYGVGLLESIKLQTNLKLVFLNGCSTKGQVEKLLEAGVPAVVATSVKIGDTKARLFAENFYGNMAKGLELAEAFNLASELITKNTNKPVREIDDPIRGLSYLIEPETPGDPDWGLYINKGKQEVATWKFPDKSFYEVFIRNEIHTSSSGSPGDNLLTAFYNVLMTFSEELPKFTELEKKFGGEKWDKEKFDIREVKDAILNSLPSPIAEQLRKLLVPEDDESTSEARLRFLINTYTVMVDLLAFVMFSQLWEVLEEQKKSNTICINGELKRLMNEFFDLGKLDRQGYDVVPLIGAISNTL